MASYFDDEVDPEAEEQSRDTVVTLSWGAVAGVGIALLLLCGLCFGIGYVVGHHGAGSGAASATAQAGAGDQTPLEGNGSAPKPSADAQAPVAPAATPQSAPAGATGGESPEAVAPSPAQGAQTPEAPSGAGGTQEASPGTAATTPPLVRPALSGSGTQSAPSPPAPSAAAPGVHAAMPPAATLTVQVAAVKNAEDAGVLMDALRRRGYPVSQQRDAGDGLIHVRIGPFASRDEANRWRDKLLGDGYNAVVQP